MSEWYESDQPPCWCSPVAGIPGPAFTGEEHCPAHGDPDSFPPEPPPQEDQ
jgi:hypothetical protein